MRRTVFFAIIISLFLISGSCNRRNHPTRGGKENSENPNGTGTSSAVKKTSPKAFFPKVIVVNDNAAHKSIDGRLYYDLMGHRYWRSKKDGKYYLFNKSMYTDPAFKP